MGQKTYKKTPIVNRSLVLTAGLEPARLAAGDFKSPVSAIPPCQRKRQKYYTMPKG